MLELSSNLIKVIGIFGRLSPELEAHFDAIEAKYSKKPITDEYDIFRHLTLTFENNAPVTSVNKQLKLLRDLKQFLPLKLTIKKFIIKDEESMPGAQHVAAEFSLEQTKELVEFIRSRVSEHTIATWYIKLVWFVPKENQQATIDELKDLKTLEFTDFYLVANKQNDDNTILTTNSF